MYTSCPNRISLSKILQVSLSDHFGILAVYSNKTSKSFGEGHTFIHYRDTKRFNSDAFIGDLTQVPFHLVQSIDDPNEALSLWYQMFEDTLNMLAPLRKKRVKRWHQPEWINQDILDSIHLRDLLRKEKQFDEYRRHRNTVKLKIRKARRDFYEKTISTTQGDARKTWQTIRSVDGSKTQHFPSVVNDEHGVPVHDDVSIASVFNRHFAKVCQASEMPEMAHSSEFSRKLEDYVNSKMDDSNTFSIPFLTETFVFKQLRKLKVN